MKSDAPVQSPARPGLAPDEPLEIVFAEDLDTRRSDAAEAHRSAQAPLPPAAEPGKDRHNDATECDEATGGRSTGQFVWDCLERGPLVWRVRIARAVQE